MTLRNPEPDLQHVLVQVNIQKYDYLVKQKTFSLLRCSQWTSIWPVSPE